MGPDDRTTAGSATAPASSRLWPVILLFVTAIIYGLTFSLNQVAITAGIPFAAYVFWHALGGTILLFLFCLMRGDLPKLTKPHLKAYSSIAVVGLVIPFGTFAFVAPKLPAGVVGMTLALIPILTYLFVLVLRMESFKIVRLAGIFLGLAGVLLIVIPETSLPSPEMVVWVLVAMAAPLGLSFATIWGASMRTPDMKSHQIACGVLAAGTIILFAIMAATESWWWFEAPLDRGDAALLLVTVILAIIWVLVFEIIYLAGPLFLTMFDNLATLTGVGWGILILAESHSLWIWGALVLLLGGVYLVNKTGPAAAKPAA